MLLLRYLWERLPCLIWERSSRTLLIQDHLGHCGQTWLPASMRGAHALPDLQGRATQPSMLRCAFPGRCG